MICKTSKSPAQVRQQPKSVRTTAWRHHSVTEYSCQPYFCTQQGIPDIPCSSCFIFDSWLPPSAFFPYFLFLKDLLEWSRDGSLRESQWHPIHPFWSSKPATGVEEPRWITTSLSATEVAAGGTRCVGRTNFTDTQSGVAAVNSWGWEDKPPSHFLVRPQAHQPSWPAFRYSLRPRRRQHI